MTLAAVSMGALTVQRNGKRPRGNTKTGDKRGNEKPRQGNWLTRIAYQWHGHHCLMHCCGSHGKRMMGIKDYKIHSFWTLKCIKTVYFCLQSQELNGFKWSHIWSEKLHIFPSLESHFFSLCMCWCLCVKLQQDPAVFAHRLHIKHVAKCTLCVFPLCVCIWNPLSVDRVPGCPRWL